MPRRAASVTVAGGGSAAFRPVPLFRPVFGSAVLGRVAAVLASGWVGYGAQCEELEQRFIAQRGGWAVATSSCTAALYLAGLLCRGADDDVEAIVPAVTFVSSAAAFTHAGFRVRIADVERATLTLTAETAARCLTPRTRVIVVVHLYGQRAPDLAGLRALADRHDVALVEDCAHRIDLDETGLRLGDLACFSFNGVKELPAGEGGLLCGRAAALEARARVLSNVGLVSDTRARVRTALHRNYRFATDGGLKLRANDVAAALALGALDDWPQARAARRARCDRYDALLAPFAPEVTPLPRAPGHSGLMYVIRARLRADLRRHLAARRIATAIHYPSLAGHPRYAADADARAGDAALDAPVLTLPTSLTMMDEVQERVVAAIATAHARRQR